MAQNDWIATLMYNQPSSLDEVVAHGITPENTDIKSADYYKNNKTVQETFQKDGKFDEDTFNTFYDSALSMYNQFSSTDWTNKLIDQLAKDPLDYTQPMKTEVKDISATIFVNPYTPDRRAAGIEGIGKISDPVFSLREIAQDNYVRDEKGNVLDWTPNQHSGIYKSLMDPTLALATYDEDTTELVNGIEITHKKGDFKFDENGNAYYEILGNRDSYGKDVLHYTDTLTVDGTTLNKFDFFDTDGLTKSVGGTLMKTAVTMLPYLIPGVNTFMGAVGVVYGLASIAPTLGKAVNGIFGDNNSDFGQALTKGENFFQKFKGSQSDEARAGGFLSLENIAEILTSSASQLYSQKTLGQITYGLAKMNNVQKASDLGRKLSLGFMAITSSEQVYSDFKAAGASDAAAGIGMLASIGALYGLMSSDYFRDQLFKGTVLDESEAVDVLKNWAETEGKPVLTSLVKEGTLVPKQAVKHYNAISKSVSNWWQKFLSTPISGKAQRTLASDTAKHAWGGFTKIINRGFNEGVEETMEEVSTDLVKSLFAGANALGINVKDKKSEDLDFGFSLESIGSRYAQNFLGGFFGGMVFEGLNQYEKLFGPKVVQMMDLSSTEQIMYMIATGRTNELLDRLDVLRNKGVLGDSNLSATETRIRKNADGKEETLYAKGTSDNNQNQAMYSLLRNGIIYINNTMNDFGLNLMYGDSFLDPTKKLAMAMGNIEFDEKFKEQMEKQKAEMEDLGISADEYLANNKTNALLETIKAYKFHTSYLSDVTKLGTQYLKAKASLDALTAEKPGVSTEDEKKTEAENLKKQANVKYYQERVKELEKQRDDLIYHRNDDKYANQVLYMVSKDLQHDFEKSVLETGKESKSFWQNNVYDYANAVYGKNFNELSTAEQNRIKEEFNKTKSDDLERLKFESELYYYLIEKMSPKVKEINKKSKGLNENSYYVHDTVLINSKPFIDFEKNNAELTAFRIQLQQILDANNKITQEIYNKIFAETDKYDSIKGADIDILQENEEYDKIDLYNELQDRVNEQQKKNSEFLNNMKEIKTINDSIHDLEEKIKKYQLVYGKAGLVSNVLSTKGFNNLGTPIANALNNLNKYKKDVELIRGVMHDPDYDLSLLKSEYKLEESADSFELLKKAISRVNQVSNGIRNILINYYTTLKNEKMVSDEDSILKSVLSSICKPITENSGILTNAVQTILAQDHLTVEDDVVENFTSKAIDVITELANERINVSKINSVVALGDTIESDFFDKVIQEITGLSEFSKLINDISKLKEEIPTLNIVDMLRGYEINVGDTTLKIIDLLQREESTLNSLGDPSAYFISDESANMALHNIPAVIDMLVSMLSPFTNGYSNTLNVYRKKAKKDFLENDLTDTSRHFLMSECAYLKNKALALIDIADGNKTQKINFHKNSEITHKKNAIQGLILDTNADDITLSDAIKTELGNDFDLKAFWNDACGESVFDDVNESNIADFTKAFVNFANKVYSEFKKLKDAEPDDVKDEDKIETKLVNAIMKYLPNDSFNTLSGEYNDKKDEKSTSYANALFLASIVTIDFKDQMTKLDKIIKAQDKIIPLWGQEMSVLYGTAFMTNPQIFNEITRKLKNEKLDAFIKEGSDIFAPEFLKELSVIENICFMPGTAGTGKTSVVAFLVKELLKANSDNAEFVVIAPQNTQAKALQNIMEVDDKHVILLSDLLKTICPTRPKSDEESTHSDRITETINVIGTDADLFAGSGPKYIFFDEATFGSESDFQILAEWAKNRNIKIFCTGDYNQNGKMVDGGAYSTIDDCIMTVFPELSAIIRSENVAIQQNTIASKVLTTRFTSEHRKKKDLPLDKIIINNLDLNLIYYEKAGSTFVGGKLINDSQVDHYIDDFANFDEGKKSVAIITDNESKYSGVSAKYKNVTIISANNVQGGEFDYVIVDKSFADAKTKLYTKILDLNTMLSRAKQGIVIVDKGDLKDINISCSSRESSVAMEPTLLSNYKKDLENFYNMSNSKWLEESSSSEPKIDSKSSDSSEESNSDDETDDSDNEEKRKKEFETGAAIASLIDPAKDDTSTKSTNTEKRNGKHSSESDTNIPPKNHSSIGASGIVLASGTKRSDINDDSKFKTIKEGDILYDRKVFIDELESDKSSLWKTEATNKYSIRNIFGTINDSQYRSFIRLFSSAVSVGMGIENRHLDKLSDQTSLSKSKLDAIRTAWNVLSNNDYNLLLLPVDGKEQRSIIYLPLVVNGEKYLIPVGTTSGTIYGVVTIPKGQIPFTLAQKSGMSTYPSNAGEHSIRLFPYGTTYSKNKVFKPLDEDEYGDDGKDGLYATSKCWGFKFENSGKTFTAWSPVDILTDEDFDKIWFSKTIGKNKHAYYTNTVIQRNVPLNQEEINAWNEILTLRAEYNANKNKKEAAESIRNIKDKIKNAERVNNPEGTNSLLQLGVLSSKAGSSTGDPILAPISLFENHRTITVADAINLVWIQKYVSGLNYGMLNDAQKNLFTGENRLNAIAYLRNILGNFEWRTTGLGTVDEQHDANVENIKNLKTKYKLFPQSATSHLFNEVLRTCQALESTQTGIYSQLEQNIIELLFRTKPATTGKGNDYQVGLQVTFKSNEKGSDKRHTYLVKFNSDSHQFDIYAKQRDNAENDLNKYSDWEDVPFKSISASGVVSKAGGTLEFHLKHIVDEIANDTKNAGFKQDWSIKNLRTSNILLELKQVVYNSEEKKTNIYNMIDWDLMFHLFKKINITDFTQFENEFRKGYFRNGLHLNDAASIIKDPSSTAWADLNTNDSTNERVSNIAAFLPPIYKLNAMIKSAIVDEENTSKTVEKLVTLIFGENEKTESGITTKKVNNTKIIKAVKVLCQNHNKLRFSNEKLKKLNSVNDDSLSEDELIKRLEQKIEEESGKKVTISKDGLGNYQIAVDTNNEKNINPSVTPVPSSSVNTESSPDSFIEKFKTNIEKELEGQITCKNISIISTNEEGLTEFTFEDGNGIIHTCIHHPIMGPIHKTVWDAFQNIIASGIISPDTNIYTEIKSFIKNPFNYYKNKVTSFENEVYNGLIKPDTNLYNDYKSFIAALDNIIADGDDEFYEEDNTPVSC